MDNKLHIVYATDAGYLLPTLVAAASAIAWASNRSRVVIHILDCGLTEDEWCSFEATLRKSFGGDFGLIRHLVDMSAYLNYKQWRFSRGIYARLDIPNILANIDWCVYADGDTLFTDDPLKLMPLWNDRFALMGHLDGFNETQPKWFAQHGYAFDDQHYICAGFILMNLVWFRIERADRTCFELLERHPDIPYNDQDVLNIVCRERIGLLPDPWGCTPFALPDNPSCIHYTFEKPWIPIDRKYFNFSGCMLVWMRFARRYVGVRMWQIPGYGVRKYFDGWMRTKLSPILFGILNKVPFLKGRYSHSLALVWPESKICSCLPSS